MQEKSDRIIFLDVEEYFSEFVDFYGGKIIEEMDVDLTDVLNADYYFDTPESIAELKCFKKDVFSGEEDFPKIQRLLTKWRNKKIISEAQFRNFIFKGTQLPKKCINEINQIASKTIERAIHKANKQIQSSKETFDIQDSKGILFLVNDGNYFFENADFLAIISSILTRKFPNPSFDVIIYLTVNQASKIPESNLDYTVWIPIYTRINKNGDTVEDIELFNLVDDLGRKFIDFFEFKSGIVIKDRKELNSEEEIYEIKEHKYIPKNQIFRH